MKIPYEQKNVFKFNCFNVFFVKLFFKPIYLVNLIRSIVSFTLLLTGIIYFTYAALFLFQSRKVFESILFVFFFTIYITTINFYIFSSTKISEITSIMIEEQKNLTKQMICRAQIKDYEMFEKNLEITSKNFKDLLLSTYNCVLQFFRSLVYIFLLQNFFYSSAREFIDLLPVFLNFVQIAQTIFIILFYKNFSTCQEDISITEILESQQTIFALKASQNIEKLFMKKIKDHQQSKINFLNLFILFPSILTMIIVFFLSYKQLSKVFSSDIKFYLQIAFYTAGIHKTMSYFSLVLILLSIFNILYSLKNYIQYTRILKSFFERYSSKSDQIKNSIDPIAFLNKLNLKRTKTHPILVEDIEELNFYNVSCKYEKGPIVLKELNLNVKRGVCTFIVGLSGAGKSSIINTMIGETQLVEGEIVLRDTRGALQNIEEIDYEDLMQRYFYIVRQDFLQIDHLKDLTSQATIKHFLSESVPSATSDQISKIVSDLKIFENVDQLQNIKESMNSLSKEQKTKVFIAKILLSIKNSNNGIIVSFDESLDSLDENSISVCLSIIQECCIRGKCNLLIISHSSFVLNKIIEIFGSENVELIFLSHGKAKTYKMSNEKDKVIRQLENIGVK